MLLCLNCSEEGQSSQREVSVERDHDFLLTFLLHLHEKKILVSVLTVTFIDKAGPHLRVKPAF